MLIDPRHISGWVNGNLYIPTTEVLGILPIPESIRVGSAMRPYDAAFDRRQKHSFLARIQGTHKPILPIHTSAEKKLFRDLMNSNSAFSSISGEPRWENAVKDWNLRADGMDDISYKVFPKLSTLNLNLTIS
jgi:hypothetical protein